MTPWKNTKLKKAAKTKSRHETAFNTGECLNLKYLGTTILGCYAKTPDFLGIL